MKVRMDADELYPFYAASPDWDMGKEVEVPDEVFAYWQDVMSQFSVVQSQMRAYMRGE